MSDLVGQCLSVGSYARSEKALLNAHCDIALKNNNMLHFLSRISCVVFSLCHQHC